LPILLGSTGGTALVVVLCLVMFCRHIRHRKSHPPTGDYISFFPNYIAQSSLTWSY
jgi:hypothetical protein